MPKRRNAPTTRHRFSRSAFNLQTVLDTLVVSATRLCEAHDCVIFLREGERLHVRAHHGPIPMDLVDWPVGPGWVTGRAVVGRQTVHVHDLQASVQEFPDGAQMAKRMGHRTILAVPLTRGDQAIGAILIRRTEVKPFSDKQIELVQTFADQAVIAIENVRLFEAEQQRSRELSESLEQQTATSEVLKVISSSPGDLQPVFEAMLANATRLCEAKFGVLYRSEGDAFRAVALHGAPLAYAEERRRNPIVRPHSESTLGRAVATKRAVQIADVLKLPAYFDPPSGYTSPQLPKLAGARTVLAVPMCKDDELVGIIAIYRQEVRPFTDKQIELLQNFAAQAVIAIENTRLLNELRQSLEQQTATADVLRVISSSPGELEPVFQAMLENAVRICDAAFGNLMLYDGEAFRFAALHGARPKWEEMARREPVLRVRPSSPLGRVAASKQLNHIEDIRKEQAYIERQPATVALAELAGARTVLNVPMLKDNELIGTFSIYRSEVRPFTEKQINLVQNFAAQAVIAIENARLLNELRQRTGDLTEALEQQTATSEVLQVISSSPGEVEPLFQAMLENATRICEAKFGTLFRFEGHAYRAVATHNAPQELMDEYGRHGLRAAAHRGIEHVQTLFGKGRVQLLHDARRIR
jgi:GAF domain-containing protein